MAGGPDQTLAEGVVAALAGAKGVPLAQLVRLDRDVAHTKRYTSHDVGEAPLDPAEVCQSSEEENRCGRRGQADQVPRSVWLTQHGPAKALHHSHHRVDGRERPPWLVQQRARIRD